MQMYLGLSLIEPDMEYLEEVGSPQKPELGQLRAVNESNAGRETAAQDLKVDVTILNFSSSPYAPGCISWDSRQVNAEHGRKLNVEQRVVRPRVYEA
ncbi:MAG: hypothetical protein Q7T05_04740 [Dehalococcoidia bacterium]|nr:hypothetical protein [Dehalococcoidia bacterium]